MKARDGLRLRQDLAGLNVTRLLEKSGEDHLIQAYEVENPGRSYFLTTMRRHYIVFAG